MMDEPNLPSSDVMLSGNESYHQQVSSTIMSDLDQRESGARKARRARDLDSGSILSRSNMIALLPEMELRDKRLWLPYPSEVFPTDYNQRLPEWRWRASHSEKQDHWKNWKEFQLATLGSVLGLSNVLYFPFITSMNGFGAYVYTYILIEFLVGFPILFLQMALGQFTSKSTVDVFNLVPLAQGTGYSMAMLSFINIIRAALRQAQLIFFAFTAFNIHFSPFTWDVPWKNCTWSEEEVSHHLQCNHFDMYIFNQSRSAYCPMKYLHDEILQMEGDECYPEMNGINWPLIGCLFCFYLIAYAFVFKGIVSIARTFIVAVPLACSFFVIYLFAKILSGNNLVGTMSAALIGVQRFFTPDWEEMNDVTFWFMVTSQMFRSLNLDLGTMTVIGSFARFQSATHYHAFYVILADVGLSLLAGIIVHCHWGMTLAEKNVDILKLKSRRVHVNDANVFMNIINSIDDMKAFSPVWVFLTFSVLTVLGVTGTVAEALIFMKPFYDRFPHLKKWQIFLNGIFFFVLFLISAPMVTSDSKTREMIINTTLAYSPTKFIGHFLVAIMVGAFIYCYGLIRLCQDLDFMLQFYPNKVFRAIWLSLPVAILILTCAQIFLPDWDEPQYSKHWSQWVLVVVVCLPIPVMALWNVVFFYRRGELAKVLRVDEELYWVQSEEFDRTNTLPQRSRRRDPKLIRHGATSTIMMDDHLT